MNVINIYTDGGCRGNQSDSNIGGWGAVLEYKGFIKEIYGNSKNTTNNIQELTACLESLKILKTTHIPIEIYSDSRYLVDNMNKYVKIWSKRNWIKSDRTPVLNKELWQLILELSESQDNIKFIWVKGHSTNEGNNRADELANLAMNSMAQDGGK